jgi:small-conductance mechanosensitive channel
MLKKIKLFLPPFIFLVASVILNYEMIPAFEALDESLKVIAQIALVICCTWFSIVVIRIFKKVLIDKLDLVNPVNNLESRKLYTQYDLLEKILVFIIIICALGTIFLLFDNVKKIGLSIFASAGIAGIVLGFAAQKAFGTILAGLQIAFTQPIILNDEVLVENEWGWIEEINLTYVVVRLWDQRRLILPSTYFIENSFQNWTRTNSDLIGSVFINVDYNMPIDAMRTEVSKVLDQTTLWDQKVNIVQVTDSQSGSIQVRILVGARNATDTWDLRVIVREKIILFITKNYPGCLPKNRLTK